MTFRDIYVGMSCDEWTFISIGSSITNQIWTSITNPALYDGHLNNVCVTFGSTKGGGTGRWCTLTKSGTTFTIVDTTASFTIAADLYDAKYTNTSANLEINAGDYIGLCITATTASRSPIIQWAGLTDGRIWSAMNQSCTVGAHTFIENLNTGVGLAIYGIGEEDSSTPNAPDLCQNTDFLIIDETWNGYGDIRVDDIDCPDDVLVHLTKPWGGTVDVTIADGTKETYTRGTNPEEYWTVESTDFFCSGSGNMAKFRECWYRDGDVYYVKTTGNDSNFGTTWDEAFLTITKAANEVPDNGRVYIGFGTYNSETDITPDNFGYSGVKYFPVTAGANSGTGSVTINL